ncbi:MULTISPECIES: hypothetical protein [unclassified Archaeoglobus]|jgi:hypothetical protein|uniref:hypothetical protein n=1 Tax=unclassified Archaeoglobus TaxID=2643606 RepID=UPI0025BF10FD|nr:MULTISPECIES: hypothetical protein [unclassified Archaeoglobus]
MDEFEYILMEDDEEEVEGEDDVKLAEIYKLASRLLTLLEGIKSFELKESASLMLIREIVGDDKVLMGLATKMLQDMSFGFEDDESYVS